MSIDTCKSCCRYVDTDYDIDCYDLHDENGDVIETTYKCLCVRCREAKEKEIYDEKLALTTSN
jgi:hypothetical protein